MSKYFHLDEFSVRNGQRVEAGQQVGTMGRTGNTPAQGDTHLHFELWRAGRQIDPMPYLRGAERGAAVSARVVTADVLWDGASGPAVQELQQRLNQLGYRGADGRPLETASGVFGSQTEHALRTFQADHGVKVDGIHGAQTRDALAAALRERAGSQRDAASGPALPESTQPVARGEDAQRSFVDRLFSAMQGGDDRAMRQALDDYLKTPAGKGWQPQEASADRSTDRSDPSRDQAGPAR